MSEETSLFPNPNGCLLPVSDSLPQILIYAMLSDNVKGYT